MNKKLKGRTNFILTLILSFLIIISGYFYNMYSKVSRVKIDRDEVTDFDFAKAEESEDVILIALFGSDYSEYYETSSSDSTMILSINTKNNTIKLCSLMRDIYLDLPTGGKMNLNYTILSEGPSSILKAMNYNFKLDIDKFVQVDLERLPKIIDALGGVEIEITSDELNYINDYIDNIDSKNGTSTEYVTSSGLQLLDGTQASAYCRVRYTEGRDFKRTERQRDVLNSLFVKFKDISLAEVPSLMSDILPLITTNLTNSEIISYATKGLSMGLSNIDHSRYPSDENILETEFTDMYHMNIDIEATTEELQDFLYR